jgi:hypothetical protein
MRFWSLAMVVLAGFTFVGLANAADLAPATIAGNSVVFAPQRTPGGTVILRGSVPVNSTASPAPPPSRLQNAGPPPLSSSAPGIGWDRSGIGPQ